MRRPLFYSDFRAVGIYDADPGEALRTLDEAKALNYQGVHAYRTLDWPGGLGTTPAAAYRSLGPWLNECRQRGLKVHLDNGINWASDALERAHEQRLADIVGDGGYSDTVAMLSCWNEPAVTLRYGATGRTLALADELIAIWHRKSPGLAAAAGCWITSNPGDVLASQHAGVSDVQQDRGYDAFTQMRRVFALRNLGVSVWNSEPTGPGKPVYAPINDPDLLVGLYGAMLGSGQATNWFSGPGIDHLTPMGSVWGWRELPRVAAWIPEDIATWSGFPWLTQGERWVLVTAEPWREVQNPPRPVKDWQTVGPSGDVELWGKGQPDPPSGWKARVFFGTWA